MARLLPAARRGQGGFALMTVLAVIALTAVVIVALFGMLVTTMRATASQETAARELRAADGAIEAAIAQMRTRPGPSTDPCAVEGVDAVEQVHFDQDTPGTGDDVTVDVECQVDVVGEDSGATGDQVRLVGSDGYQGDVAWTTDCGGAGPGCFPWSAATGSVPGGLAGSGVTLVHSGPEALRFNSGVTVKRGAATLRNPTDGSPAVRVGGQYLQGDPGLLGGGDGCGLLDGSAGTEAGRIEDLDGAPTCGDPGARDVFTSPTEARAGLPIPDTVVGSVPGCSGSVITFPPGRYDAARTAQLNDLFDGSCPGRTFHFPGPGYHFDANDPSAGPDRNAIVFDDASSRFVFGALAGGDELCDRGTSGASVVISARTEIQHRAGRLAICPRFDGTGEPFPAIYQETSVPNQPTLVGVTSNNFQNIGNVGTDPDSDSYAHAKFTCNFNLSTCTSTSKSFTTTWSHPGEGPLTSAVFSMTGSERYPVNLVLRRTVELTVTSAGGAQICRHTFDGLPNSYRTAAYDLLQPGSDCVGKLTDQSQLNGARISVRPIYRFPWSLADQEFRVRAVGLRTNVWSGVVGSAGSRNGEWINPGNVIADDAQSATPAMTCPYSVCEMPPRPQRTDEHQLTTAGIDIDVPGVIESVAEAPVTSLVAHVKVDPPAYLTPWLPRDNAFFLPTGFTQLDLRTASGASCSVTFEGHVNSLQTAAFDLLHPSGNCAPLLSTVQQLEGAALDVTFGMDCQVDLFAPDKCWQVRPPEIQHVELAVTSDAWSGPPPTSRATIDADAGSTFNVFGTAWMPVSDLDIHWRGAATPEPLFGGEVVLHGLGSDMAPDAEMGAVCCSVHQPDTRTVDLVAKVGGEDRLRVKVRFLDRDPDSGEYSPGHSVVILDYRTCRRGGCGPNEPPPPGS